MPNWNQSEAEGARRTDPEDLAPGTRSRNSRLLSVKDGDLNLSGASLASKLGIFADMEGEYADVDQQGLTSRFCLKCATW